MPAAVLLLRRSFGRGLAVAILLHSTGRPNALQQLFYYTMASQLIGTVDRVGFRARSCARDDSRLPLSM
ncbi:hypothetical protein V8C44DRAFT_336209 [Trichoderma aethiopicum]